MFVDNLILLLTLKADEDANKAITPIVVNVLLIINKLLRNNDAISYNNIKII